MTFWTVMFWSCCALLGACVAMAGSVGQLNPWIGALCLLVAFNLAWCADDAFKHVRFGWDYHVEAATR